MSEATTSEPRPGDLGLPAQVIPVPGSLSAEARQFLGQMIARSQTPAAANAARAEAMLAPAAARFTGAFDEIDLGNGATLYRATPDGLTGRRARVACLDIHGGGFTSGGGAMCRMMARIRAADYGATVYAIDYRLAPAHPYPAALDDCLAAYRAVLAEVSAADLVVSGSSAGGNLAAALLLRAAVEGLAYPAGLLLMTPAIDMRGDGDSRTVNRLLDVSLLGSSAGPAAYRGKTSPDDPYLSPIMGEIGAGWPPTMLTTGTRDLLLSDAVRMHRKLREAGVDARLFVTEAGMHIGFMGTAPEDRFIMAESRKFLEEIWGAG